MAFLPPSPVRGAPLAPLAEAPAVSMNPYLEREVPGFLRPATEVPPRPRLDGRLRRADERFQAGKKLYQEGDFEGARREFDRAVDALLGAPEDASDRPRLEKRLDELVESIHRYDLDGLGAGQPEPEPSFEKSPIDDILEMTFPVDPKLRKKVRDEIQATASQLPLEPNDAVLSYVNYFSSQRGRKTVIGGLRRAGRYRPLISRILDEEGLPQELIFLAQAESGFMPRAVSRKKATGMWQFVQYRGREYGLMQTPYSDDRLDPERATRAAARHLRDLFEEFGDWYLAMAAYNCGPVTVERAIQRTGYADFWELRSRNVLPRETANYVPAIVAMVIVAKNRKDYGIDEIVPDAPLEYDSFPLKASAHLALIGDITDQPVTTLREMNPALLKNLAPAGYELRLPKGSAPSVAVALEAVPESRRTAWRLHRVQAGDTVAGIAKRYKVGVNSLASANPRGIESVEPGDLLVVPAAPAPEPRLAARRPARKGSSSTRATVASKRPLSHPAAKKAAGASYQSARLSTKPAAIKR